MDRIIFGSSAIIFGIIFFIFGTYKLRKNPDASLKDKKWWRIRGQIGGIFFIILGLLIILGFIDKVFGI